MESFLLEVYHKGIESVIKKYHLTACVQDRLLILNYQKKKVPACCRGLVLTTQNDDESKSPYQVVAPSLHSFTNQISWKQVDHVQTKEDGTLMILYSFENKWRVNCRFNFGDDMLPYDAKTTYGEKFWQLFAPNLVFHLLPGTVYYFEMCTQSNWIVQEYQTDRLYLIGACSLKGKSFSPGQCNELAASLKVMRPQQFPCASEKELNELLGQLSPTTEGFLVYHQDGTMTKVKQRHYHILNQLKYRDYVFLTPRRAKIVSDLPLEVMERMGCNMEEVTARLSSDMFPKHKNSHDMISCFSMFSLLGFQEHLGLSEFRKETNSWKVTCTCRTSMTLNKLRKDWVRPRFCYCGVKIAPSYIVSVNRFLYVCSLCQNTHECRQTAPFAPLGIPCSFTCKIYRLHLHDLLDPLWRQKVCDKNTAYHWLSQVLECPREETHVARMDQLALMKAIPYFFVVNALQKQLKQFFILKLVMDFLIS